MTGPWLRGSHSRPVPCEEWTAEQWARLDADLRELEATDPQVRTAKERLDEVLSDHEWWRRGMVRDVWAEDETEETR